MLPSEFHPLNTATTLLQKIGAGTADADFARAVHLAVERAGETKKKAKVVLTVEVMPRDDVGSLILRASVEAKLPKLVPPATQMHLGADGELLTQMEFLMEGGRSEAPTPISAAADAARLSAPAPLAASPTSQSGRLAAAPAAAPLAAAPAPAPIADKKDA